MLHGKKIHPEIIGAYKPEKDKLICPRNLKEMGQYIEEKPNHGMSYGMPAISNSEYKNFIDTSISMLHRLLTRGRRDTTMRNNPFESGRIRNYVLFYAGIVVIMILFFFASSLFNDVDVIEKKVFNTDIKEKTTKTPASKEEEKNNPFKLKLLDKAY